VVATVAAYFKQRPDALAARSRRRDVLLPRQLAMYLGHRYTSASLSEIGAVLGRDHSAAANAVRKIERQILECAPLRYQVEALSARLDGMVGDRRE
jgi:ATPase involved in DNA replication initiation